MFGFCHEDGWKSRWVVSDWKRSEGKAGTFKHTAGKWPGDHDDKGFRPSFFLDKIIFVCLYFVKMFNHANLGNLSVSCFTTLDVS